MLPVINSSSTNKYHCVSENVLLGESHRQHVWVIFHIKSKEIFIFFYDNMWSKYILQDSAFGVHQNLSCLHKLFRRRNCIIIRMIQLLSGTLEMQFTVVWHPSYIFITKILLSLVGLITLAPALTIGFVCMPFSYCTMKRSSRPCTANQKLLFMFRNHLKQADILFDNNSHWII